MTDDDLKTVTALVEGSTGAGKLPWWLNENDGGICCGPDGADALEVGYTDMNEVDTALVLAAPTLVAGLVAEVRQLRAELVAGRAVIDAGQRLIAALRDERDAWQKRHDRMVFERDEAHRLVRESFAEVRKAVEASTAERIAEWLEDRSSWNGDLLGGCAVAAERIRAGGWRRQ